MAVHIQRLSPASQGRLTKEENTTTVQHYMIIKRRPMEVYHFCRKFKNLPLFVKNLKKITLLSPTLVEWSYELKTDVVLEGKVQITGDISGKMLSWKSQEGSIIEESGKLSFENGIDSHETVLRISLTYSLSKNKLIQFFHKLFGKNVESLLIMNLHRLKYYLEKNATLVS